MEIKIGALEREEVDRRTRIDILTDEEEKIRAEREQFEAERQRKEASFIGVSFLMKNRFWNSCIFIALITVD